MPMVENREPEGTTNIDKQGCGCDGDCCPPKKKSWWSKVIFTIVLLAAAGIIVTKLFFPAHQAPAATKQVVNDPNSPCWSDSSGSKSGCDTTKSSSCCPK